MGGHGAGGPGARGEDIEWVDDGLGVLSWRRGWPDFQRPWHVVLGVCVGLATGAGLWLAGRVLSNPNERVRRGLALLLSGGPVTIRDPSSQAAASPQKGTGGLPLFEAS